MITVFAYILICLRAFPDAEGAGALSRGGRGGVVLKVTNLDNSGYGSLRWALEENGGPRTIVFDTSGVITLNWPIRIDSPFVTIAGQTSPGGIVVRGENMDYTLFEVRTHDVVMRYLRIRPGHRAPDCAAIRICDFDDGDSIYNIMLDHLSISWNTDEGIDIWGPASLIDDVTIQNCLLAEPLKAHPTTMLTGGNTSEDAETVKRIDFHHNMIINTGHRNPLVKTPFFRFVNNIVYNWYFYATQIIGGVYIDIINNRYERGPLDTVYYYHSVEAGEATDQDAVDGTPSIFIEGNVGPYNPYPDSDNWVMVYSVTGENGEETGIAPIEYRRDTALSYSYYPITITSPEDLKNTLPPYVGASMRLDEYGNFIDARDSVDMRLVSEYYNGEGFIPDSEEEVGSYPSIPYYTPYPDNDGDGMSDLWEEEVGLDPNNPDDRNWTNLSPEGYTNLEVFLNGSMGIGIYEQGRNRMPVYLLSDNCKSDLLGVIHTFPAFIYIISPDGRLIVKTIHSSQDISRSLFKKHGLYFLRIKQSHTDRKTFLMINP